MPGLRGRSGRIAGVAIAGTAFALTFLAALATSDPPQPRIAKEPALPAWSASVSPPELTRHVAAPLPALRRPAPKPKPKPRRSTRRVVRAAPILAATPVAPASTPAPTPTAVPAPPPPVVAPAPVATAAPEPETTFDSSEQFDSSG
jgi:hypothetical protein